MTRPFTPAQTTAWLASLPRKNVRAKVLISSPAGRILLVKPTYKELWQFPGGGVEAGEAPEAAAVREAFEETGLQLDATHVRLVGSVFWPDRDVLTLMYEYTQAIAETASLTLPPDEIAAAQFVELNAVPSHIGEYYHNFWRQYHGRIAHSQRQDLA